LHGPALLSPRLILGDLIMGIANLDGRKPELEVATYANSLRIVLRRCGIFQWGDKSVGLHLPPDAAIDKYRDAVRLLLTGAGMFHYSVPIVRASPSEGQNSGASEALNGLSARMAVIALVAHGAELPPEVEVSLDHVMEVRSIKPYHLRTAARTVTGLTITREQASALVEFRPSLLFAAIRCSRPIEVSLEKLRGTIVLEKSDAS
jgi:cell division protease FtsH